MPQCSIQACKENFDEECGSCNECKSSICWKQDEEHDLFLLYNEGCRIHDDGYLVCRECALKAFKSKNPNGERCICPVCNWDFGLYNDLLKNPSETCIKLNCSIPRCIAYPSIDPVGLCSNCYRFSVCNNKDKEHSVALLYNEECKLHDMYGICRECASKAFKSKNPNAEGYMCPECEHTFSAV